MKYIVVIVPSWNYNEGGVNSFNFDFCLHLGEATRATLYKVICVALNDPNQSLVDIAQKHNVIVVSLAKTSLDFAFSDVVNIRQKLDSLPNAEFYYFVGHDIFTGEIANHLADENLEKAVSIVFHHMDYKSYYAIKGDSSPQEIAKKLSSQKKVLGGADYVAAVGPKLTQSAENKTLNKVPIWTIIPGLQDIVSANAGKVLQAITFGRYDKRNDRLKQMGLAAKAFAQYVESAPDESGSDATLMIIGISDRSEVDELLEEATKELNGYKNIVGLPYSTDRIELFENLSSCNICLMLSVHEGFGLVGFEAIAAAVPLILSENSGLFDFLSHELKTNDLKDYGIYSLRIKGTSDGTINGSDLAQTILAYHTLRTQNPIYKKNILKLKKSLLRKYSWQHSATFFIEKLNEIITDQVVKKKGPIEDKLKIILSGTLSYPQPVLNLSLNPNASELVYRSRYVNLEGRNDEISALKEFLASSEKLSWWSITGQGGVGKSRIALELSIYAAENQTWYAGFISGGILSKFNWENWSPAFDTLVIIDYASRYIKDVVAMLEIFGTTVAGWSKKVRILMLERTISASWYDSLQYQIKSGKIKQQWNTSPIELSPLDDAALLKIIDAIAGNDSHQTKTQILRNIQRFNNGRIPLFSIMFLLERKNRSHSQLSSNNELFKNYLQRNQIEIWGDFIPEEGEKKKFKNLLAFITIVGGLTTADISLVTNQFPDFFYDPKNDFAVFEALNLFDHSSDFIRPIEPDIIGEFFVADHFVPLDSRPELSKGAVKEIMAFAWEFNPAQVRDFISRMITDHPWVDLELFFIEPPVGSSVDQKTEWLILHSVIITQYARDGGFNDGRIESLYKYLCDYINKQPEDLLAAQAEILQTIVAETVECGHDSVVSGYTKGLVNLTKALRGTNTFKNISYLFNRLARKCMFKFNIKLAKEFIGHLKTMDRYDDTIVSGHFREKLLAELPWYANTATRIAKVGELDFNHPVIVDVNERERFLKEAEGLALLIYQALPAGNLESGIIYYNRLREICYAYNEPAFYEFLAYGASYFIYNGVTKQKFVEEPLKDLENLVFNHSTPRITELWITAWKETFEDLITWNLARAEILVPAIEKICDIPFNAGIIKMLFWSFRYSLLQHYIGNLQETKALEEYGNIMKMFDRPDEQRDAPLACQAAIKLSVFYEKRGDVERHLLYKDEAKRIADNHDLDFERTWYMSAIFFGSFD